jgi:hypothetical protein
VSLGNIDPEGIARAFLPEVCSKGLPQPPGINPHNIFFGCIVARLLSIQALADRLLADLVGAAMHVGLYNKSQKIAQTFGSAK